MGKKLQEGFTLIELMVVVAMMGLALTLAVPAANDFVSSNRMAGASNDVVSSLQLARSEALKRRTSVTLCASASWASPTAGCDAGGLLGGWIIFRDDNTNGAIDNAELPILGAHGPLPESIITNAKSTTDGGATKYVSFRSDGLRQDLPGLPPAVQNLQLCDSRGNRDSGGGMAAGRWISISLPGRIAVAHTVDQLQSTDNPLRGC